MPVLDFAGVVKLIQLRCGVPLITPLLSLCSPLPPRVAVWPSVNGVDLVNEVDLRQARLSRLMRRVTVRGYPVSICNRPLRPTQPPTFSGMGNEYRRRGSGSAPRLGR